MALQRIFTQEYVNELNNNIISVNYLADVFPYKPEQVRQLRGIEKPEGLEDKMLAAPNEFEAAKLLYENYKAISPALASCPMLWIYLTHVDLARYVKKMWPNIEKYDTGKNKGKDRPESARVTYIKDHWMMSPNGLTRTTLMNLWWGVYLTVDESKGDDHKYDLTKMFFSNNGLRTRRLGSGHLGRNREALKGILTFMNDNADLFDQGGIENRMIWITRHFNLIGGSKPLANMKAKFFITELEKYKDHIRNIKKREDVIGKDVFV